VVKNWSGLGAVVFFAGACATLAPPPPTFYIENPSTSVSSGLSLDARIAVDEVWTLLRQGRTDKAEKAVLRLGEKHPFFEAGLGYVALLRDDYAGAEARFQQSIRAVPELTTARLGLGQVYQKLGRWEDALKSYVEVLKRNPDDAFAAGEAGVLRETIVAALQADAEEAVRAGRQAEAKEAYLRILEYSPKLQGAHLALARIFVQEKDFAGALFHLRTATGNDPKDKTALQEYAEALYQMDQFSRSLDAYQRLLTLDPADKPAKERVDVLKVRLGVIDLPEEYRDISGLEAVTKEAVAALIGAKFEDIRAEAAGPPPVIVDISTSWARTYIVKAAAFGIMEVFSNHTFQPKKNLTRAEMAETLVRLVEYLKKKGRPIVAQIPEDRIRIADVPPEHPFVRPITSAVSYQLMDLSRDRTFRPELTVSGAEAIRILDLLAGLAK
jgi:tetratricopeptide (TPR) repeat protein